MQCNLTKFSPHIIVDVTYLISGIYTNFRSSLCKKVRRIGYYVIKHGVMKLMTTAASVHSFNFIITQNS